MKKVLCFLFAVLMTVSFVACDSGKDSSNTSSNNSASNNSSGNNVGANSGTSTPSNVDSSLKTGKVNPVGDVFELTDIKQATGAPILTEISKQAYPGDSIMVAGEGFKKSDIKFYVYALNEKGKGVTKEAKFTVVDDNYASILIDSDLKYGMYAVYAKTSSGTSEVKTVNKAAIWSIGLYKLSAGEKLTVLGENLTTDNGDKTSVFLVSADGKEYAQASVSFADPGKVEIIIPDGLKVGSKYKVYIHNGHGGEQGFAISEDYVEYLAEPAVQFNGKIINVVDHGADPKARANDDSEAFRKALSAAKDGDTIYFPPGSYLLFSKVVVSKSVRILGAGADKTTIFAGYNGGGGAYAGGIINIKAGPCEITGIRFEQKRTQGKLNNYFVDFSSGKTEDGEYNLYFHHNVLIQSVSSKSRSSTWPINVTNSYGVIIEDNYFDATAMIYVADSSKVFVRRNEGIISAVCGVYYHICDIIFTNVNTIDCSNNTVTGAGAPNDPKEGSGPLINDTYTAGRVFVVQGWAINTYISHNTVRRAGIPNTNSGEIILFENLAYNFDGYAKSATDTTLTTAKGDKNTINVGNVVSVISGKGRGQYRRVVKRSTNTITLDRPWDIVPDQTSRIIANGGYLNSFVCYNNLDGHSNWAEVPGATTGLQAYGAIHNMFYCHNKVSNTSTGIDFTPFYYEDVTGFQVDNARCVIAWSQFDRNTLEKMGRAISMTITTSSKSPSKAIPGEIAFGNMFRANDIRDISRWTGGDRAGSGGLGIRMGPGSSGWSGNWCVANLFEANNFSNCADNDVTFYDNQANNIFRNNKNGNSKARYNITSQKLGPIEPKY